MSELAGRVAIVTGASQGIGRGIALAFADAGASIVAAARSAQKLDETCAEVAARGGKAVPVVCNVQDADEVGPALHGRSTNSAVSTSWSTTRRTSVTSS